MKRVLIYSHDTVGLGNIRRSLVIANDLVERRPDTTVLIISGSPMLHAFRIRAGIDYIKLPCLDRATNADTYRVKSLGIAFNDLIRLRASLIQQTVMDFEPDLILVDKKPLGVGRELAPAFELLSLRGRKPKCALVLRDILDEPKQTIKTWEENRYYQAIDTFYDAVFVLGEQRVFDLAAEYEFPTSISNKVQFCGYLRRPAGIRGAAAVRAELKLNSQPLVVVTVGGGEDGGPLLDCYIRCLRLGGGKITHNSLILTGPDLPVEHRQKLENAVAELANCHLGEFSDDCMSELEAADLVISMGGYNTICEILTLGKPAVVVPRALPVREQLIRAERMAGLGLIEMLHPDELSGVSLLEIVKRKLSEIRPQSGPDDRLNLNGIEHLANAIDELIPPETKAISAPSLTTETCAKCVSHDKSSLLETVVHVGASGARRRGNAA